MRGIRWVGYVAYFGGNEFRLKNIMKSHQLRDGCTWEIILKKNVKYTDWMRMGLDQLRLVFNG